MSLWVGFEEDHLLALERLLLHAEVTDDAQADVASIRERIAHYQSQALRDERFIEGANSLDFVREGECEVDESTVVSASDEGAYVMAWVWVSNENAGIAFCLGCDTQLGCPGDEPKICKSCKEIEDE